ncbi:hypothetical protein NDU88_007152 [Pleurodeles waltl]|uniref:Uncharacterized protein n=1 Tax=Pleurodeles waltl TaxID=8319 RepID=A0AAV7UN19_PLEWA|nr:hypothetical protein NDU88_007152 [Pleurodeles waltl]
MSSLLPPLTLEEEAGSAVRSRSTIHAKAPSGTANSCKEGATRLGKGAQNSPAFRTIPGTPGWGGSRFYLAGANGDQFLTRKERAHQLQPQGLHGAGRVGPRREKGGCGERSGASSGGGSSCGWLTAPLRLAPPTLCVAQAASLGVRGAQRSGAAGMLSTYLGAAAVVTAWCAWTWLCWRWQGIRQEVSPEVRRLALPLPSLLAL